MKQKVLGTAVLLLCLLVLPGGLCPCGAEDYVAKKGLAFYRTDLQNLTDQVLRLDPDDRDELEFLDRLFRMKFAEVERMFAMCGDGDEIRRQIAELYLLKAVESKTMGNWIQAYFALEDAKGWSKGALAQQIRVGGKRIDVAGFSDDLEKRIRTKGNEVRFVIKPFPPDKMFHPDKVVLARSEEETPPREAARAGRGGATRSGGQTREAQEGVSVSEQDNGFLLRRFAKALYAYYYDPVESNAEFVLYLPYGDYYLYEKDFRVHPVEFQVSGRSTQVVLEPARWFRLAISEEVHPSDVRLTFHGVEWKDFHHVPFGSYRIHVKSKKFTVPDVRMTFVPKDAALADEVEERGTGGTGKIVAVEDGGLYRLVLRERTGTEKLRYKLLGY